MNPDLTAIHRKKASKPLRFLLNETSIMKGKVLDFGCGHGEDVAELKRRGFDIVGFDPFHMPTLIKNRHKFDVVLLTYVVNVLEVPMRNEVIKAAWNRVRKGGRLIVTSRTPGELRTLAERGLWVVYKRGYITGKGTYQRGYTCQQIDVLVRKQLDNIKGTALITPSHAGGAMVIILKE
jgi:DNA phosphorothioation-associated putative methyltransferase